MAYRFVHAADIHLDRRCVRSPSATRARRADRQCHAAGFRADRRPVHRRAGGRAAAGRRPLRRRADLDEDGPVPGRAGQAPARGGGPHLRDPRQPRRAVEDHEGTAVPRIGEGLRRPGRCRHDRACGGRLRRRPAWAQLRPAARARKPAGEVQAARRWRREHRADAHQPRRFVWPRPLRALRRGRPACLGVSLLGAWGMFIDATSCTSRRRDPQGRHRRDAGHAAGPRHQRGGAEIRHAGDGRGRPHRHGRGAGHQHRAVRARRGRPRAGSTSGARSRRRSKPPSDGRATPPPPSISWRG